MNQRYTLSSQDLERLVSSLPSFDRLKNKIQSNANNELFLDFYGYALRNHRASYSQLFQDLFVEYMHSGSENLSFIEFGATNGITLSNSFMLEQKLNWSGVLAEPDPQWHKDLMVNRPKAKIITDCIFSETGQKLDFISSQFGELSTIKSFARSEENFSSKGNVQARLQKYEKIKVNTISLNDVCAENFSGKTIDYMSVDTEGSELDILRNFDFDKYKPAVITVEHNFTDSEKRLDELICGTGYQRLFGGSSAWDAWYSSNELYEKKMSQIHCSQ